MTLVTIGLLLGLVGLIWTMVIRIVCGDLPRSRHYCHTSEKPVPKPMGHESRAA